jgi:hypothetical protein
MMNNIKLADFLLTAKKNSYAAGDKAVKIKLPDGATEITHERERWKYRDRYYGGEPFCGEEVVFYDHEAVWAMNFYGRVSEDGRSRMGDIYEFLRKSMALVDPSAPFRGPKTHRDKEFKYHNTYDGTLSQFNGTEYITYEGEEVYRAYYHGGVVNIIK